MNDFNEMNYLDRRGFLAGLIASVAAVGVLPTSMAKPDRVYLTDTDAFFYRELPTLEEIVKRTVRARQGQLADNIFANNALLQRLA